MKKFEMPEIQVVTFDEDIMAINFESTNAYLDAEENGIGQGNGLF